MKYILLITLFLISCTKEGTKVSVENALSDFHVNLLFTKDGCDVYRFFDEGRYHYFTNCTETISSYTRSCGKNCTTTNNENIKEK